tara:strand:+ start:719 stop:895 length:177 start_codon:yes stop_codon:yes gene_type:complete
MQQSINLKQAINILKTLSDKHLSNMLKQRQDTNSDFKQAILSEISVRCVKEYIKKHGV